MTPLSKQPAGDTSGDANPPPERPTISYEQALDQAEKAKAPPPPAPKSTLKAITVELQNISGQLGVSGLGKGVTIPTQILIDANAFSPSSMYANAAPVRKLNNALTAKMPQLENELESNFNNVTMKPFRDTTTDTSALKHANDIIDVYGKAAVLLKPASGQCKPVQQHCRQGGQRSHELQRSYRHSIMHPKSGEGRHLRHRGQYQFNFVAVFYKS